MKTHSKFSFAGMRAFMWELYKRLSGERTLPTHFTNPSRPNAKAWIVYTPGMSGVVISPIEAKPDEVHDNPLSCA